MQLRTTARALPLVTVVVLAACGGGGGGDGVASLGGDAKDDDTTATTLSQEEQEEAMIDWTACMREQGIDMPDPQFDANGRSGVIIRGSGPDDDDQESGGASPGGPVDVEDFERAQEACGEPPMLGGEITEEDRREMQERGLEFAECMRDNGIEDFPDPDFSDMGPGRGPGTRIERSKEDDDDTAKDGQRHEVVAGPFGVVELDDPEVKAAFETCQETVGFGPGAPGGPPVAASGSTSS
jgi:hypothetical protein